MKNARKQTAVYLSSEEMETLKCLAIINKVAVTRAVSQLLSFYLKNNPSIVAKIEKLKTIIDFDTEVKP